MKQEPWNTSFDVWKQQTQRILTRAFGPDSLELKQYDDIRYHPIASLDALLNPNTKEQKQYFHYGLYRARRLLKSIVEDLDESIGKKTEDVGLTCPVCAADKPKLLGLYETGSKELEGGIPILKAKKGMTNRMAYYICRECSRVFSIEPTK